MRFKIDSGQPITKVEYTPEEVATWSTIFHHVTQLYPTHACLEFNNMFPVMVEHCGYKEDAIPQLQDVSDFLYGIFFLSAFIRDF